MNKKDHDLVSILLENTSIDLPIKIPAEISFNFPSADELIAKIEKIYHSSAQNEYFKTSIPRYRHYFSIAKNIAIKSKILEIGSAPGHVSIGLYLLGMDLTCINLNEIYRKYYPNDEWIKKLNVLEHDIEKSPLPFEENAFDVVFFSEVLEHIAIKKPIDIFRDIIRVLKPEGKLILSTPNICNVSNIYSLLKGKNIFWPSDIFYGSLDRHNREFTPSEVYRLVEEAGFNNIGMYGFNCHSNWRGDGTEFAYKVIEKFGDEHPLLRNTIMIVAQK